MVVVMGMNFMRHLLVVILLFVFSGLLYADTAVSEMETDFSSVIILLEQMIAMQDTEMRWLEQQIQQDNQQIVQIQYVIGLTAFLCGVVLCFVFVYGMKLGR